MNEHQSLTAIKSEFLSKYKFPTKVLGSNYSNFKPLRSRAVTRVNN